MDLSKIPINKKIINKTGNDVKFDLRSICEQVQAEICDENNMILTLASSESLRLLYMKAEQLGLIIEDINIEPNPEIKHTVTLINNNDCVDYIKYIFNNITDNNKLFDKKIMQNTQETFEIFEGNYVIDLVGPNHYMSGAEEVLVNVNLLVNSKSENATYNFGVEEIIFNNHTNTLVSIKMDKNEPYVKQFNVNPMRNNEVGKNGTFITNNIEHNVEMSIQSVTGNRITKSLKIPIHANQTIYEVDITENMFNEE